MNTQRHHDPEITQVATLLAAANTLPRVAVLDEMPATRQAAIAADATAGLHDITTDMPVIAFGGDVDMTTFGHAKQDSNFTEAETTRQTTLTPQHHTTR